MVCEYDVFLPGGELMEYIEREAASAAMPDDYYGWRDKQIFNFIPAADVVPVVHGRWIWDRDGMDWGIGAWRCSECKVMSPMWWNADETNPRTKSGHRFCPNCGARMDGDA